RQSQCEFRYNYPAACSHPTARSGQLPAIASPTGVFAMKRFTALVLVASFVLVTAQIATSQSRPRRVGATPPVQQSDQQNQTQSQPDSQPSTDVVRPSRPPVLGG